MKNRLINIRETLRNSQGHNRNSIHQQPNTPSNHTKDYGDDKFKKFSQLIKQKQLPKAQFQNALSSINQKINQKKISYRLKKDYQEMKFLVSYNQRLHQKFNKKIDKMRKLKNQAQKNIPFEIVQKQIKKTNKQLKISQFLNLDLESGYLGEQNGYDFKDDNKENYYGNDDGGNTIGKIKSLNIRKKNFIKTFTTKVGKIQTNRIVQNGSFEKQDLSCSRNYCRNQNQNQNQKQKQRQGQKLKPKNLRYFQNSMHQYQGLKKLAECIKVPNAAITVSNSNYTTPKNIKNCMSVDVYSRNDYHSNTQLFKKKSKVNHHNLSKSKNERINNFSANENTNNLRSVSNINKQINGNGNTIKNSKSNLKTKYAKHVNMNRIIGNDGLGTTTATNLSQVRTIKNLHQQQKQKQALYQKQRNKTFKKQQFFEKEIKDKLSLLQQLNIMSEAQLKMVTKNIQKQMNKFNLQCQPQNISQKMRKYIVNHIILQKFLRVVCQDINLLQIKNNKKIKDIYLKIKQEMVSIKSDQQNFLDKLKSLKQYQQQCIKQNQNLQRIIQINQQNRKNTAKKAFFSQYSVKQNQLIQQIQKIFIKAHYFLTDAYIKCGKQDPQNQLDQILIGGNISDLIVSSILQEGL